MLAEIWHLGKLSGDESGMEVIDGHGDARKRESKGWKRIGLVVDREVDHEEESVEEELFGEIGELGLECLVSYFSRSSQRLVDD